jgi:RHS repeat-associated protein
MKVVNGTATIFLYSLNGQIIAELNAAGNTTVEYVYLNGLPLAQIANGNTYYYHNDHLGTPQKMTDGTGAVMWSADYKPFGEATITVSTITNNLRFPGQYFDAETGLNYNYMRDYNPAIGRYIEKDPIGFRGGINLYAYVKNQPTNRIDPYGLLDAGTAAGFGGSAYGLYQDFTKLPTTPGKAALWGVDVISNQLGIISGLLPDSAAKSYADVALGTLGVGIAVVGDSYLAPVLAGYALGDAINKMQLYGSNQTVGDWWVDYWWNLNHPQEQPKKQGCQ